MLDYYPYGKLLRSYFAEKADRFQTTENERDAETGLDYRMARYYDAEYGRFLAVDPLAGQFLGRSPYNYVMGNPVGLVDPTGLAPEGENWWLGSSYFYLG